MIVATTRSSRVVGRNCVFARVAMTGRTSRTDERRAVRALLMHDAAAALHSVASSAVVPLLKCTTLATPGDVHIVGPHLVLGIAPIYVDGVSRGVER